MDAVELQIVRQDEKQAIPRADIYYCQKFHYFAIFDNMPATLSQDRDSVTLPARRR